MFFGATGSVIGGAGFPGELPVVLATSAVALALGAIAGIAASVLAVASGLTACARVAQGRRRSRRRRGMTLVTGRTATP